jgi:hypothetical protein
MMLEAARSPPSGKTPVLPGAAPSSTSASLEKDNVRPRSGAAAGTRRPCRIERHYTNPCDRHNLGRAFLRHPPCSSAPRRQNEGAVAEGTRILVPVMPVSRRRCNLATRRLKGDEKHRPILAYHEQKLSADAMPVAEFQPVSSPASETVRPYGSAFRLSLPAAQATTATARGAPTPVNARAAAIIPFLADGGESLRTCGKHLLPGCSGHAPARTT